MVLVRIRRLCVDKYMLSAVMRCDTYPLASIEESLLALTGSTYLSMLDLFSV